MKDDRATATHRRISSSAVLAALAEVDKTVDNEYCNGNITRPAWHAICRTIHAENAKAYGCGPCKCSACVCAGCADGSCK